MTRRIILLPGVAIRVMLFVHFEAFPIAGQRSLQIVRPHDGQLVAPNTPGLLNAVVLSGSIEIDRLLLVPNGRIKVAGFRRSSGQSVDVLSAFPFDEITSFLGVFDACLPVSK